jgi:hypothetical protein
MPKQFKSITDIIGRDKAFAKFRKSIREQDVQVEFHNIFPDLKRTVTVSNVNKGVLYLSVQNSVLKNELFFKKKIVLQKINDYFNQPVIDDIKFSNFKKI